MHLQNSRTQWNFRAGPWVSEQKFAERLATKGKSEKTLAPSGRLKNVFSGRQMGLIQEETLVVFYTLMPRETVRTTRDEEERRKKFSPRASKWRKRLTEKLEQSRGQSCEWSYKFLVYCGARWKRSSCDSRQHPVCRGYKSGNRCIHGYRCLHRPADGKK